MVGNLRLMYIKPFGDMASHYVRAYTFEFIGLGALAAYVVARWYKYVVDLEKSFEGSIEDQTASKNGHAKPNEKTKNLESSSRHGKKKPCNKIDRESHGSREVNFTVENCTIADDAVADPLVSTCSHTTELELCLQNGNIERAVSRYIQLRKSMLDLASQKPCRKLSVGEKLREHADQIIILVVDDDKIARMLNSLENAVGNPGQEFVDAIVTHISGFNGGSSHQFLERAGVYAVKHGLNAKIQAQKQVQGFTVKSGTGPLTVFGRESSQKPAIMGQNAFPSDYPSGLDLPGYVEQAGHAGGSDSLLFAAAACPGVEFFNDALEDPSQYCAKFDGNAEDSLTDWSNMVPVSGVESDRPSICDLWNFKGAWFDNNARQIEITPLKKKQHWICQWKVPRHMKVQRATIQYDENCGLCRLKWTGWHGLVFDPFQFAENPNKIAWRVDFVHKLQAGEVIMTWTRTKSKFDEGDREDRGNDENCDSDIVRRRTSSSFADVQPDSLISGKWKDRSDQKYEVRLASPGTWVCIKLLGGARKPHQFTVRVDMKSDKCWWGLHGKFFFDITKFRQNPHRIDWIDATGKSSHPAFEWVRIGA